MPGVWDAIKCSEFFLKEPNYRWSSKCTWSLLDYRQYTDHFLGVNCDWYMTHKQLWTHKPWRLTTEVYTVPRTSTPALHCILQKYALKSGQLIDRVCWSSGSRGRAKLRGWDPRKRCRLGMNTSEDAGMWNQTAPTRRMQNHLCKNLAALAFELNTVIIIVL